MDGQEPGERFQCYILRCWEQQKKEESGQQGGIVNQSRNFDMYTRRGGVAHSASYGQILFGDRSSSSGQQ